MILQMPDSTIVAALPPGYRQYLGYVDGDEATARDLVKRFPGLRYVLLTVTGATMAANGCDIEPGNLTAKDGAQWARQKLNRDRGARPVLYASVVGEPNYGMGNVLTALTANGISRADVRLLSAHYGAGEHICGPRTCGLIYTDMDGTQWARDITPGYDMSVLRGDFFDNPTEAWVQQLGVVQHGDTGESVRTVQGACNARHTAVAIDGIFGPQTEESVRWLQTHAGIAVDGIVGPDTWPVLLGIA